MLPHKLMLEDVEDEYLLFAIHSSYEEYKMAFFLNKYMELNLKRRKFDVDYNYGEIEASYPLYEHKEPEKYRTIYLIRNKYEGSIKRVVSSGSLFEEDDFMPHFTYLIPEYRDVDYFIKAEVDMSTKEISSFLTRLSLIPNVLTAYVVDATQLKSRNNLILE